MNDIYADRKFKMLSLLFLIISICSGDLCIHDESTRSFFFMGSISTRYSRYSLRPKPELCVCRNNSCIKTNDTKFPFEKNTIYRVVENKDIHVKYNSSRHITYKDSLLGTEYVIPMLQNINARNIHNYLGIGNPTNTEIDVRIKYSEGNRFSNKNCCPNEPSKMLRLTGFETTEFKINCQNAVIYINSSNKIIVYSAAVVESSVMIEQLLPVELWGSSYTVFPSRDISHDDIIIVLTAYDNTTIHVLGFDYVIIPNKYDSIQRRISGAHPVTIRSSNPISVIQYIIFGYKSAMINILPMKYRLDKTDIQHMNNARYAFASLKADESSGNDEKKTIFSKFYYFTDIIEEDNPQSLYGCVSEKTAQEDMVGTNCGFTDRNQTEPEWPIMEPGDGKDNDQDGNIDEDECFSSFENLKESVNKDCKNPFRSGIPDTLGTMFVLPMDDTVTLKCSVEIMSGTPPTEVNVHSKILKNETIDWKSTTIQIINGEFKTENESSTTVHTRELVIAIMKSNDVSLMCSCYKLNKTCSNSFIVPPLDILQTQYAFVMPKISENGADNIQCKVVTIFDNTSFALPMLNISGENLPHLTAINFSFAPNIQNSSVFIVASHIISLVCAQSVGDIYLVNYVLPSSGTDYRMCKNENQTKQIAMVTLDDNTALNISEIEQDNYTEYVLLEIGGSLQTYKMKNSSSFLSVMANKPILVLAWIGTSSSPINHNIIYVPAVNLALNGSMTSTNLSGSDCFSLSDYDQPQPFRLYRRELPTVSEQIPGDGIDNDGDGLVDEEYCGFLWEDYSISDIDLDGSINEDCKGCTEGEELSPLFVCKECDYGKFRENSSKIHSCQSCPDNQTTFFTKSNSSQDCVPICEKGMELVDGKCESCQVGFYKNISALDTSLNTTDRFECKRCPKNLTTYSTNSEDISDCIEHCEAGEYLSVNNCEPCKMGTYKNTSSKDISLNKMLRWNCSACEGKWATISEGSKTCFKPCRKGYQFNRTSHQCEPCPLGFYKNVTGIHFNCTQCPENYTTRATGKKSQDDCKKADCTCPCDRVHVQKNYTSSELSKLIEEMKKELIVNKDKLSSTTRKKISVMDSRPSSRSIGSFGIVIITFVFALLFAADVMILKNHISMLVRTLVDFAKGCARN